MRDPTEDCGMSEGVWHGLKEPGKTVGIARP